MARNPILLSPQSQACSHLAEHGMEGERSPFSRELGRDSPSPLGQVLSSGLTDPGWFWDDHIQVKRARVETIVQGICLSPSPLVPGNARARSSSYSLEKTPERKRKQSVPVQQFPLQPGPARNRTNWEGSPRFNRCITSQMIKWFSNFREFYYIQMEKFARQAISDGVTNPKMLVVLRNSELFRALSMHYNKGSDFEVPDCFLEIATLTLQEFFRAVSAGKDSDPSWKKPIYKIISKLDSDIPEIFKSSSYPQELLQS
ncbi:Prospero homeobox protein 2 [Heterocephalus glaber]|uniref:Prospero homeobox protein 2 n=1 Tax=Heterocephalus glaber TaxID=10181 RepID=G5C1L9_HETGA|nr:Prospero homeobox protein 2 [Heterocephalus glaber]